MYFCVVTKEERDCRKYLCVCSLSVAGPLWPRTTPHHASLFTNFSQTSSPIPSTKPRTAKPKSDSQCRTKAITPSNLSTRLRGVFFPPPGCDVFSSHMLVFFQEGIERADTCFDGYSYGGGYPPQGYPPQGYPPQQGYGGAPPVCF